MRTRSWLGLAAALALAGGGCGGCVMIDEGTSGDSEQLDFAIRTGDECGAGCALDVRPLMVGTEERIEVRGLPEDVGTPTVTTSDPTVLTAWVETSRLCCGAGRCDALTPAEVCDAGQEEVLDTVVVRALAPGEAHLVVRDAEGRRLDSTTLRAERADRVVAVSAFVAMGELPDVVGYDELGTMRGDLEEVRLRVGTATMIRLEARSAAGELLHASTGAGFRVTDPSVAVLAGGTQLEPGLGLRELAGTRAVIVPRRMGQTTIALAAGGATGALTVTAMAPCELETPDVVWSDQACSTDADCVPASCCHATSCVAAAAAPSCEGVSCTLECRTGTVDCDGRCLCLQGRCAAYLFGMEDPSCPSPSPHIPWFPFPRSPGPVDPGGDLSPTDPGLAGPDSFRAAERQPPGLEIPQPPADWGISRE